MLRVIKEHRARIVKLIRTSDPQRTEVGLRLEYRDMVRFPFSPSFDFTFLARRRSFEFFVIGTGDDDVANSSTIETLDVRL